jgi:hypothetical protein
VALTDDELVGPMQKSDAKVGVDASLTGATAAPVATTEPPMLPLSWKHSRRLGLQT